MIDNGDYILDHAVLNRLATRKNKEGISLVSKIINVYLEQSDVLLEKLTEATEKADVEAVKGISHTLKSSSANVGATGLSELCSQIEIICEQGHIDHSLVKQVHKNYSDVEQALKAVLHDENNSH